jgi:hypothetical protein
MFNQIPPELLFIVSHFLYPRDLLRFRYVSSYYEKIITTLFLKKYKNTKLYDLICPLCANDWISSFPVFDEYMDIDSYLHEAEVYDRNYLVKNTFPNKNTIRANLLCDDCGNYKEEFPPIEKFKLYGSQYNYRLFILTNTAYPWSFLIKISNNILWNEVNTQTVDIMQDNISYERYEYDDYYEEMHEDEEEDEEEENIFL